MSVQPALMLSRDPCRRSPKVLDLRSATRALAELTASKASVSLSGGDAWRPRLPALPEEDAGTDKGGACVGMLPADELLSPATRQALKLDLSLVEEDDEGCPSGEREADEVGSVHTWTYITPGASYTSSADEDGEQGEESGSGRASGCSTPEDPDQPEESADPDSEVGGSSRSSAGSEPSTERSGSPGTTTSEDCPLTGSCCSPRRTASDDRRPRAPPPSHRRPAPRSCGLDRSFSRERVMQVVRDNYRLWRRLQSVRKTPPRVPPPPPGPRKASAAVNREREMRRVERANDALRRRLEAARPVVRCGNR